ncbi:MAG: sulfatase-like hydrolase/transferase [Verrucomicrobiota bacterium JB025]|nr:sulfatase-like hydrolase/transferase [Verrucomicrobiota bacterium JB025]
MKLIMATLLACGLPLTAGAQITLGKTIAIDFGTDSTAANAYTDVVIPNGASESFPGTLKDTTGAEVAGVGFMVENLTGDDTGDAASTDRLLSNDSSSTGRLTDGDEVIDGSGDRAHFVLTFTGLDPALAYDITGGYTAANDNFTAIWQAATNAGKSFTTTTSSGYGTLQGVLADAGGNLSVHVIRSSNVDGRHVTVGDLSLTAVEPPAQPIGVGDVIRVDFGTTVPASGNYNVIHSGNLSVTNLVRFSDGTAVGVNLGVTATAPFDNAANIASTSGLAHIDASDPDVYVDGFLSTDGNNGPGNDIITLTFTGLDDSLYYDLSAALARDSSAENFSTTWTVSGATSQVSDGTAANGFVAFSGLMSTGGTLVATLTDNVRQSGLAQLALVATDTPPPAPEFPPLELPSEDVVVFFDPTDAYGSVAADALDAVTVGGNWDAVMPGTSQFAENTGGFAYVMDGAAAQGNYIELALDGGGLDFSSAEVAINFQMLATRSSSSADVQTTLIGYDEGAEIFRLNYVSGSSNTGSTITAVTADGAESMGFTPLGAIAASTMPSGLQDFRVVLLGNQVRFGGSSLTSQDGGVLNAAQKLTHLRWEITGTNAGNQGFWLDDLQIRHGAPDVPRDAADRPNVIFILTDDMGYSDLSCYGATKVDTPNLDALADGGLRFTDFISAANVCSPSRAAFLTGAYPMRCGIPMAVNHPNENHWFLGLDPDEITLAEQFRSRGYKTCMIGKWHLGTEDVFLPHNQGFDHYYGTWGNGGELFDEREVAFSTFPEDRLTSLYTQRVREHIRDYRDRPFFIYYPHNYPHSPYTEGNAFDGSTGNGTRSDVLRELDWGIGQIVAELEAQGILENTLIVFSSDNGAVPPSSYANAPFRGAKYNTWEGGHRVPFFLYWKDRIQQPAVMDTPQVWAMDLFPTLSEIIGAPMPTDRVYDGTSLVPLLTGQAIARDGEAPFFYYNGENLQCVRRGDWKLHVPRTREQLPWWDQQGAVTEYRLYDLATDVHEDTNLADTYPAIVDELTGLADAAILDLGEFEVPGSGQRGTGTIFPEVPVIVNLEADWDDVADWNTLSAAERGRGTTRFGTGGAVSPAGDYLDETTVPYGWEYLESSEPVGGTEVALTPGLVVGTAGNTGFAGSGSAALLGSATAGSFVIDSANTGNGGEQGTDLLVVPDGDSSRDHVIVRYTIDALDVSFGKTRASVTGSFRDLVGGTSDDSIVVHVFHNETQLFAAAGADGRLLEADGSFELAGLSVAAGDTISFVVGSNGSAVGDEAALNASIDFETESSPQELSLGIETEVGFASGWAALELRATTGLGYQVERSRDLIEWEWVDDIPFLPASPYDVYVEAGEDRFFWRVGPGE